MTDRKHQRGKAALKRYDDLLRAAVDWVWETDGNFALTGVTESIATFLGFASATLRGMPLTTLFCERVLVGQDPEGGGLAAMMESRRSFRQHPVSVMTRERDVISCLLSGVPFYDDETGVFSGYRGTGLWVHDLDVRDNDLGDSHRRLLALLDYALEQKDALERENNKRDSLQSWSRLGAIAHELRTPLNAILGFSEIIRDWRIGDSPERYREYGGIIHDSGLHLLDVVNDLLEITDKESQALKHTEPVDMTKVVSFVMIVMEERAEQIGVDLINALPAVLPMVKGERRALRQILLNLLSNALRYTPTGGEVRLDAEATREDMIHLHIRDTGIGIAPEEQDKVFERYYRAKGSEGSEEGKGLGLAISRQLARELGGDIQVESSLGEGSCFSLILPVAREQPVDDEMVPSALRGEPDAVGEAVAERQVAQDRPKPRAPQSKSAGRTKPKDR